MNDARWQEEVDKLADELFVLAIAMTPGQTAREKMQNFYVDLVRRYELSPMITSSDRAFRNSLTRDIGRIERVLVRTDPNGHDPGDEDRLR